MNRGAEPTSPRPAAYIPGVSFTQPDAYDRFMGRYSVPLAPRFLDLAGVGEGMRVLDVGCGPGALTSELVRRLGAVAVSAVDPSEPFVAAARDRLPNVDVRLGPAEDLPYVDREFDAALAQLVVHFMADPARGLREMARVRREEGIVAACVWDHAGGRGPLNPFWEAAHRLDVDVTDESLLAGARGGHLTELFEMAGIRDIDEGSVSVTVEHPTFEEWWEPFTLGVGPAGAFVAGLDADLRARLRESCREQLPAAPFEVTARAWAARGRVAAEHPAAQVAWAEEAVRTQSPAPPWETERLVLRHVVMDDFDALFSYQSRDDVASLLPWGPRTEEEVRTSLSLKLARTSISSEGDALALAIVQKATNEMIGDAILQLVSVEHRTAEIGYIIHPDHQGHGFATEASVVLLAHAFDHLQLHRVIGRVEARHTGSARVLEKLGMRREAHFVENEFVKGGWQSELVYAILDREWSDASARA